MRVDDYYYDWYFDLIVDTINQLCVMSRNIFIRRRHLIKALPTTIHIM